MNVRKLYNGMKKMENVDIETYLLEHPDKLFLLVTSTCLPEKKTGTYRLMLKFSGSSKMITNNLKDVSNANQCILIGIRDALISLQVPNYEVIIVNCVGTGINRYVEKNNNQNKEIIEDIFSILNSKNCTLTEFIFTGKANDIKYIINATYPLSKDKKNNNSLKTLNIQDYTKEVIVNTKRELYTKIAKNMITQGCSEQLIGKVLEMDVNNVRRLLNYKVK